MGCPCMIKVEGIDPTKNKKGWKKAKIIDLWYFFKTKKNYYLKKKPEL